MWFYITSTGYVLRGGYYAFTTEYLNTFPIAPSKPDQEHLVEKLVDYIMFMKTIDRSNDIKTSAKRHLMVAYFEQIIDGIIYEIYFPEDFKAVGKSIISLIKENNIPDINQIKEDKLNNVETIFDKLYLVDNEVRKTLFFLDNISSVKTIEEMARGI